MATTPINRVYELRQLQYPDEPALYVGDTVYYALLEYPREPRFVVDAKIVEVQFVISHPTWKEAQYSLWFNINPRLPTRVEKLVLMVSPQGEFHAIGGDKNEKVHPGDEDVFPGMEFLRDGISRSLRKASLATTSVVNERVAKHLQYAFSELFTLQAILTLEYHDKNHLAHGTNPKLLNESQRELLQVALNKLDSLRKELGFPVDG